MPKPLPELLADLRAEPSEGVLRNVLSDLKEYEIHGVRELAERVERRLNAPIGDDASRRVVLGAALAETEQELRGLLEDGSPLRRSLRVEIPARRLEFGGVRRRSQSATFGRCVKAVRKTVKARKGSNPESAAIAICTTSILHPRGRTIKRYRKGRLLTQTRR